MINQRTIVLMFRVALVVADVQQTFPSNFKFGVSSSAYQIEGGWDQNEKGKNIWDEMIRVNPNWIIDNQTGYKACDSYNLWRRDVEMLNELGVHYYSFSLSWSRLLPNGFSNYISTDAVHYYNNLINELIKNEIEPVVTLYYWDLPQIFQDMGGWPNPTLATYFESYARVAFDLFGDRVKTWITFNDPYEICVGGYGEGNQAPGVKSSGISDYQCGKTLLIAHAKAYHLYKNKYARLQNGNENNLKRTLQKKGKISGQIGIAIKAQWYEPASLLSDDIEAAMRTFEMISGWWIHPIFSKNGGYPDVMKARIQTVSKHQHFHGSRLPHLSAFEVKHIKGSADFLGLNHFTTIIVRNLSSPENLPVSFFTDINIKQEDDLNWKPTALSWVKNIPYGLRKLLDWIRQKYENPLIYITENGYPDFGQTNDFDRIDYLKGYMIELLNAVHYDGCNVQRYTVRSLMDSMEWRSGYTVKFGLYQVNFADEFTTRTPKDSAEFFKNVILTKQVNHSSTYIINRNDIGINPR